MCPLKVTQVFLIAFYLKVYSHIYYSQAIINAFT